MVSLDSPSKVHICFQHLNRLLWVGNLLLSEKKIPVMECGLWVKCQIAQMKATKH